MAATRAYRRRAHPRTATSGASEQPDRRSADSSLTGWESTHRFSRLLADAPESRTGGVEEGEGWRLALRAHYIEPRRVRRRAALQGDEVRPSPRHNLCPRREHAEVRAPYGRHRASLLRGQRAPLRERRISANQSTLIEARASLRVAEAPEPWLVASPLRATQIPRERRSHQRVSTAVVRSAFVRSGRRRGDSDAAGGRDLARKRGNTIIRAVWWAQAVSWSVDLSLR